MTTKPITIRPITVHGTGQTKVSYEVGSLIREDLILDPKGTVLDTEVLEKGGFVELPVFENYNFLDLWGRKINRVDVPPMHRVSKTKGMVFLSGVPLLANAVARAVETEEPPHTVQKMVDSYYLKLLAEVAGKNGLLARGVFGARIPYSGRLVVVPSIDRHPNWVGVHHQTMKDVGAKEGDLLIVGRDPVIWGGSIEVVRVYPIEGAVIRVHPLLFSQMGMDCDGDQMFIARPAQENPTIRGELEAFEGKWMLAHAKWPKLLCPNEMTPDPDWDNIIEDSKTRFEHNLWTYGPKEALLPGKNVKALEEATGKQIGARNKKIASGGDANRGLVIKTSSAQMRMKRELGLVGATSRRLLYIAGSDEYLVRSAFIVSERLQQLKLDAKHGEELDAVMIFEMFERRGKWRNASISAMSSTLEGAGISKEDSFPILAHLYIEVPYEGAIENLCGDPVKRMEASAIIRKTLRSEAPDLAKATQEVAKLIGASPEKLGRDALDLQTVGLRKTFLTKFPFMALITSTRESDRILQYHRVQCRRERDEYGLLSVVMAS